MAFAVASKRAPLAAGLLNNLRRAAPSSSFLSPASVAATCRLYSTPFHRDYHYYAAPSIGDELVLYHHQLLAPHFFQPMFFSPQIFRPMFFTPAAPAGMCWVSKQDEDAVEVSVAMPGLSKERVKVWTNKKVLFIKSQGEGIKGQDDAVVQDPAPYICHIELSAGEFDLGMKVGVPRG